MEEDSTSPAQKIILDCGPGHDDTIAMLLTHGNPNLELLAVITVAGNQTLEKSPPMRARSHELTVSPAFPLPLVPRVRWWARNLSPMKSTAILASMAHNCLSLVSR